MSFVLCCFHFFIFLITLARNEMAAQFHDGFWFLKLILALGGYVGSFYIPNKFFNNYYLRFAEIISVVFLIYQALLMLVVSYKINETLVNNYNNDETKCSAIILMSTTISITFSNLFWIVLQYKDFNGPYNNTFMSFTLIGIILMYGLIFISSRKDASILTSSIASLYCLYLQWTALSSDSN